MIDGPIGKYGAPVNIPALDRSENARIVGADAMIAHDEVAVLRNVHQRKIAQVLVLRRNIRLGNKFPVDVYGALAYFHRFARQTDHALDERLRAIERIPEHDHITALDGLEPVNEFVDKNAFLVGEQRSHAGAFDFYRLIQENDDHQCETDSDEEVARPDANLVAQGVRRRGPSGGACIRAVTFRAGSQLASSRKRG